MITLIKRIYRTEEECAGLWTSEAFDAIHEDWFFNWPDFCERFEFMGLDGETGEYGPTHEPMWSTWWRISEWLDQVWISEHPEETAEAGFTLIYLDGELFALGVDGAGYGFLEAHWVPLYRARALKWHDEASEEDD